MICVHYVNTLVTGEFPPNDGLPPRSSPACRTPLRPRAAFSLTELLVVMAVISVMAVAAMSGVSSVNRTSQIGRSMSTLGGVMDFSRQYAIANNTYTYVGFSGQSNATTVGVFASKTGRPLFRSGSNTYNLDTPAGATNAFPAAPARELSQMTLSTNAVGTYGGWSPPAPPVQASELNKSWKFTSQKKEYSHIVGFSPSGSALVASDGTLVEVIEMGFLPPNGNGQQGFAVRLSGLTGLNKLIQP